jgi:hypothetical protein
MNFNEKRFRLRIGNTVVGYMRKISGTSVFYSPDAFWWSGRKIDYNEVDEWTGLKDKNNRYIYEWDILYFKLDPYKDYTRGVVLWENKSETFGIRALDEEVFIPLKVNGVNMFNSRETQVFSYLFLNKELQNQLGVKE